MMPEADHSPRTDVEVKNDRSYTSTSHVCLSDVGWENITFAIFIRHVANKRL